MPPTHKKPINQSLRGEGTTVFTLALLYSRVNDFTKISVNVVSKGRHVRAAHPLSFKRATCYDGVPLGAGGYAHVLGIFHIYDDHSWNIDMRISKRVVNILNDLCVDIIII